MKDAAAKPRREVERSGRPAAAPTTEPFLGAGDGPGPTGASPAVVAHLQLHAGNGAVAGLLAPLQRKGDAGSCPPPPPAPVPANPHADPKFARVAAGAGRASKDLKSHPPAAQEAQSVRDAAEPPSDDKASQAKAAQVETMSAAKPKGFDKAGFIAAVKGAIAAAAPKDLDEADSFPTSSKPDEIKASVASKVTSGKSDSAKDVAEKTSKPPNLSAAKGKVVVPLKAPPPVKPVAVNGAAGMPDRAPPEQTDFRGGPCEVDGTMRAEGVTEEHLVKSNEAPMQDAAVAKREAEAHAAAAPGAVRQHEGSTLRAAQVGAGADAKAGVAAMAATRTGSGSRVAAQKAAAKAKEEADRARVSGDINAIFDRTKTETEAILTGLDDKVSTLFDAGEAYAKAAFTAKHTADMERYKDIRYSGLDGAARWTNDLFAGLPPEANQIFERARAVYEAKMTEVISRLADVIGAELQRAKARIEQGRREIKTYVANQPKELQKLASETAQAVGEQFDELESDVDDKQAQLVDDLAQRYVESRNGVDEEIKAEQEKNKGLVDKAKDAVGGAIDAIVKLKDLFAGVLARAASAFTAILDDPIGFIGNFFSALGQGFTNFSNNILTHLKQGVFGWLLGTLSNAGIEMPDSFDIKGIFKLIASILGLTWSSIKSRIMRIAPWIGKGIDVVESKVEVFAVLASQGVAGVWEWIKDKVGDLSEMVIGPVKEFVSEKIIQAGVSWLLGLLNPAGALIKIIQALVGVVQWLVERGAQLADFLNTVIDAVGEVARGGIGGVPAKIESALAKAVPLVISFLASLLNLGGISEKVKSVLDAVKKPVGKAIDGVIKSGLKAAKALLGRVKKAGGRAKEAVLKALKLRKPFSINGHDHELFVEVKKGQVVFEMASSRRYLLIDRIDQALKHPTLQGEHAEAKLMRANLEKMKGILRSQAERISTALWSSSNKTQQAMDVEIEDETTYIIASLEMFGKALDIEHLKGSIYVIAGEIRAEYRGNIRRTFYGGRWDDAATKKGVDDLRLCRKEKAKGGWITHAWHRLPNWYVCPGVGREPHLANAASRDGRFSLDHIEPVSGHWNREGHRCTQEERVTFYNELDNLRGICKSCNSSREKPRFIPTIADTFRGPGE